MLEKRKEIWDMEEQVQKKKILITYFEPFHRRKENSSKIVGEILEAILNDKELFPNLHCEPLNLHVLKRSSRIIPSDLTKLKGKLDENFDYVISMGEEILFFKARLERTCYDKYPKMYFAPNILNYKTKQFWKIKNKPIKRWNWSACNQVQNELFQYSLEHNLNIKWEFIHFPKFKIHLYKNIYISDIISFLGY